MYDACPVCGRKFQRAPGYFLGAIYFNYGVTAALMVQLGIGVKVAVTRFVWPADDPRARRNRLLLRHHYRHLVNGPGKRRGSYQRS